MTSTVTQAPAIAQVEAVVDQLAPRVSAARARQLRWVVGELARAVADPVMPPEAAGSLAGLLDVEPVAVYLTLAAAGRLRRLPSQRARASAASMRVRVDCLRLIGEEAGLEVAVPRVSQQDAKPVVSAGQQATLFRRLADMAAAAPPGRVPMSLPVRDRVRLLALVAVVLDTGARAGELEAMRVTDLGEGEASVVVRRRPQNATHLPEVIEEFPLREGTRVAVRNWLRVRADLVAPLVGDKSALWVSLKWYQRRPPGMPLLNRGIRRAYARGVAALNVEMAGQFGWEPLPTTLEQLRRAVDAEQPVGVP